MRISKHPSGRAGYHRKEERMGREGMGALVSLFGRSEEERSGGEGSTVTAQKLLTVTEDLLPGRLYVRYSLECLQEPFYRGRL